MTLEIEAEKLKEFYRDMVKIRAMDDKLFSLQRQGRIGTYGQLKGSEAVQAGAARALDKNDWFVPSYRENGIIHLRGVSVGSIFLYWAGNEIGAKFPDGLKTLPVSIPVGSQPLHAVGIGMAAKIKKDKTAVLTCFGDGATSQGELHEAMNFAGVFNAPVVFLCTNNQYAISLKRTKQTKTETLAEKAKAYGFEGIVIDGMDVAAVYQTVAKALEKARNGDGPTFIEAVTFRLCDHTTSDDATLYQDQAEVAKWREKDPVTSLKKHLESNNLWSADDENRLIADVKKEIDEGIKALDSAKMPTPEEIFGFTYASQPQLNWQLKDLKGFLGRKDHA